MQQLSLFCSWLQKQPGLVQELCVPYLRFQSVIEQGAYCDVAEQSACRKQQRGPQHHHQQQQKQHVLL
jgi:hypothetical protein